MNIDEKEVAALVAAFQQLAAKLETLIDTLQSLATNGVQIVPSPPKA